MTFVHYIDAIALRAADALRTGARGVIAESRMVYGQAADIERLVSALNQLADDGQLRIVDLSCAQSLGDATRLEPLLEYAAKHPVLSVFDSGVAARASEVIAKARFGVATVEYGARRLGGAADSTSNATFREARPGTHPGVAAYLREAAFCTVGGDFRAAYRAWRSDWLTQRVRLALQPPPPGHRWLGLGDGTVANYWIDVKQLIAHPDDSVALAYHVAREITGDFRQLLDSANREIERTLVVGSNTSAAIASLVRALLGDVLKVVVFDRLGPFAHVSRARLSVLQPTPPQIFILEDVVSTGRELDLVTLLALTRDSDVHLAVTLFDLEVGLPRLVSSARHVAMSRPRLAIGYNRSLEKDVTGDIWGI